MNFCAAFTGILLVIYTNFQEQSSLEKLKKIIEKLKNDDPKTREKGEQEMNKLVIDEFEANKDINDLIKEIKRHKKETMDIECKARLDSVINNLSREEWSKLKEIPIKTHCPNRAVISNNKLIVWDPNSIHKLECAICDFISNKWINLKDIQVKASFNLEILEDYLIVWYETKGNYKTIAYNMSDNSSSEMDWPFDNLDAVNFKNVGNRLVAFTNNKYAIYDFIKNKWSEPKKMPFENLLFTICSKDKMFFWGKDKDEDYNSGAMYNCVNAKWTKIKAAPIEYRSLSCKIISDTKLIIWGGRRDRQLKNDGAIYDISNDSWTKMRDCPLEGTIIHTGGLWQNKVVIWGFFEKDNTSFTEGAVYNMASNSWTKIKTPFFEGESKIIKNKLILLGKEDNKRIGAIYDIDIGKWMKMEKFPFEHKHAYVTTVSSNHMFVLGGFIYGEIDQGKACYEGFIYKPPLLIVDSESE